MGNFYQLDTRQLKSLLQKVILVSEQVDGQSAFATEKSWPYYEKKSRALTAIEYVIENNLSALKNKKLLKTNLFFYQLEKKPAFKVAAIHIQLHDNLTAEVKWLGSYGGKGSELMKYALDKAKELGATKATVSSKWESDVFYSKQGFNRDSDETPKVNPFSGSALVSMNKPLNENTMTKKTLTIFDIDDTLMRTHITVRVNMPDGRKMSLSQEEFENYDLRPGENYDFSDYSDADLFYNTGNPIPHIWKTAQSTLRNIQRIPGSQVVIITARGIFDNHKKYLSTFVRHGLHIPHANIYNVNGTHKKKFLIKKLLDAHNYTEVRIFDDNQTVIRDFIELSAKFPHIVFKAFHIEKNGNIPPAIVRNGDKNDR